MTSIDIDQLPLATGGPQGRQATIPIETARASRRDVLGYTVRAATFLGLTGLTLFRSPRRAGAENPPWNEFNSCGHYDPGDAQTCDDNMCVGTSLEYMDNGYCTTDCTMVDVNNWYQWHRNKAYGTLQYRDYPGDICVPGADSNTYDAWWWSVGTCGVCNPSIYRCHDGQKRLDATGEWTFTICEGLARCGEAEVRC